VILLESAEELAVKQGLTANTALKRVNALLATAYGFLNKGLLYADSASR
jgi:hypothetical protein